MVMASNINTQMMILLLSFINSFPTKHRIFSYSWDNASLPNTDYSVFSLLYTRGRYYASPDWV